MKRIDILWFIEHTVRELDVACFVGYFLKKKYNLEVEILPYHSNNYRKYSEKYSPKIVIIPYCYSSSDKGLGDCLQYFGNSIFLNLTWEQLYYNAYKDYKAPKDDLVRKCVIHHVWSNSFKEYLIEHGVEQKNILVNGQPAYKLYDKPYSLCYKNREYLSRKYNLDPHKKWIFFPENYSWAFFGKHQLNEIIIKGNNKKDVEIMVDYCRISFEKVTKWFGDLKINNDIEIILRPRPSTGMGIFLKRVQEILKTIPKNMTIGKEETVREWIMASDIVMSSHSTSLIEASIANKPVYMVIPYPVPNPIDADWYKYIQKITNLNQFKKICNSNPDVNSSKQLQRWARKEFMSRGDPIIGLADLIFKLHSSDDIFPDKQKTMLVKNNPNIKAVMNNLYRLLFKNSKAKDKECLTEEMLKKQEYNKFQEIKKILD